MFLKKTSGDELAAAMEAAMINSGLNKKAEFQSKMLKVAEYLNVAAEIFDDYNMVTQAKIAIALMNYASDPSIKESFDHNHVKDENCADCLDVSMVDDSTIEFENLAPMLEHFKDKSEFEDELDFDSFDSRKQDKLSKE